ncbi:MAG: hypothetical protein ACRC2K_11120 [Clostridium sp.]
MNRYWGLNEEDLKLRLNYQIKNKEGNIVDILYSHIVVDKKILNKEEIGKFLKKRLEEMENIKLLHPNNIYRLKGLVYFEYAIIYRYYGYIDEYMRLLEEVDNIILCGVPKYYQDSEKVKYEEFVWDYALQRVHALIMLRRFDNIYSLVTRNKGDFHTRINSIKWDYCSVDEILYTIHSEVERYGAGNKDELVEAEVKMYYALYLYLTTEDNKNEYKKIILNNAQKMIEQYNFSVYDTYIKLLDLSMEFPEIFGNILETPHKRVPADESLLSFNLIKPLTPLSKEEEGLIKKLKKDSLRGLMNKPKSIKKGKEFVRDYVVSKHNVEVTILELQNGIDEAIKNDRYYDSILLGYLNELKNKIYYEYEIGNLNEVNTCLEEYREKVFKLSEEVLEDAQDEESPRTYFIILGYRLVDLALIYSLLDNEEEALKCFEESTVFLKGEILSVEQIDMLPRDIEEGCRMFITNLLAHARINKLTNIDMTYFNAIELEDVELDKLSEDEFFELQEEICGKDLYSEYFIGRVEGADINDLLLTSTQMLMVEKFFSKSVEEYEQILNILKAILDIDKAKNKEKAKEKILKSVDKLYNSINCFEKYIEFYPICEDLRKHINAIVV